MSDRPSGIDQGPVWATASPDLIPILRRHLWYPKDIWIQGPFGGKHKTVRQLCVDKKGRFLSGFLNKAKKVIAAEKSNDRLYEIGPFPDFEEYEEQDLKGITLRYFQKEALDAIKSEYRGVILAPTGSGKTVIALALLSTLKLPAVIVIDSTSGKALLHQTYEEVKKYFAKDLVGIVGDGRAEYRDITVGLINSLYRNSKGERNLSRWRNEVGMVIVDECHTVSTFNGMHAQFLKALPNAWVRVGLTGTLPTDSEAKAALEGLIGPVIYRVEEKQLESMNIISYVSVRLIPVGEFKKIRDMKYKDAYVEGIVFSEMRNKTILSAVSFLVNEEKRSVLVFVTRVEHGQNLEDLAREYLSNLKVQFIQGKTEGEVRNVARKKLNAGELDVAITTTVWKQGVDIPELGAIVNAAGGKSEIQTLQVIGRGRRAGHRKNGLILVDFVDRNSRYFADHFVKRFQLYLERGWKVIK